MEPAEIKELHAEIANSTIPPIYLEDNNEVSEYLNMVSEKKLFLQAMHRSVEIKGLVVYA